MALKETIGNILEIGDRVKINLPALEREVEEYGGDGIEFTATGKNYLRYAREHPDEVYTIEGFDPEYESCPYVLSGYMSDNTWESAQLILMPAPKSRFEIIKNMTLEEMSAQLIPLICELSDCSHPLRGGVPEGHQPTQIVSSLRHPQVAGLPYGSLKAEPSSKRKTMREVSQKP